MEYDEFGINEIKESEHPYQHKDYVGKTFNKSSFIMEWIDKYIGTEINTIIDIGALDGGDTLRFSSWYPNAKIFTIEGSPNNFDVLNKKIGKRENVKTFNYIMSSVNGIVKFYQTAYSDDCGVNAEYMVMGSIYDIIDEKKNKHNLKTIESIDVESITFDEFCKINNITNVDVAHIDIEGATFDLVSGMNKIFPKLIFTEKEGIEFFKNKTTGGDIELVRALDRKGYDLVLELKNDFLFLKRNK